jgi:IclR family transcriptional regulator, acetate operon repressor
MSILNFQGVEMQSAVVPSAARTLAIFEAFQNARGPLSLSEVSRITAIPVSSCQGLMRTLETLGYLHFLSPREAYPTRKLFDIASEIHRHDPIALRMMPALQALRDETGETVLLGARQDDWLVRVLVVESAQTIRFTAVAGDRKPIHLSALGKVLLAQMPNDTLDEWLAKSQFDRVESRALKGKDRLREEVLQARQQGYYIAHGENTRDVMAMAAPLRIGATVYGLAIAGPLERMRGGERRHLRSLLSAGRALG